MFDENQQITNLTKQLEEERKQNKETLTRLSVMTSSLNCNEECQQKQKEETLKEKYKTLLNAYELAPNMLYKLRLEYIKLTKGEIATQEYIEENVKNEANTLINNITTEFNNLKSSAEKLNNIYDTEYLNSINTMKLYEDYIERNKIINEKIKNSYGDILTNDRKTYYETQEYNYLKSWYIYFLVLFYVVLIIFGIKMVSLSLSINIKILIIVLLAIYPFIINSIVLYLWNKITILKSYYPKNVYNTL